MDQKHRTQWAAQFYVAAELTRRGYMAAFTVGNTPEADLMAHSPSGESFRVDVKGLSRQNFWRVRARQPIKDLYYIFVHMPTGNAPAQYFVMTSAVAMAQVAKLMRTPVAGGKKRKSTGSGLKWAFVAKFKDKWNTLP